MGNQASSPAAAAAGGNKAKAQSAQGCPVVHDAPKQQPVAGGGGCPVVHEQKAVGDSGGGSSGGCPVVHDGGAKPEVYNVYGERIDPTNMMPYNPSQEPNEAQRFPLEQERVQSTIPKGGTEGTWLYPSEQMFFNALKRKGKGEDVHEGDMSTIVSIHNNMNERAWAQVEHYEKTCHPESQPKLLKFCGRPDTLTPIAWVKNALGYGKPFDRHDWTVQRSDNTQVRYVIDYYFDDEKSAEDQVPALHSASSVKSITMYARPAIDSFDTLVDRIKYPLTELLSGLRAPDVSKRAALLEKNQGDKESLPPLTVEEVEGTFSKIKASCRDCFQDVKTCSDEISCATAATALQMCMGRIICLPEANQFSKTLDSGSEKEVETAFAAMNARIDQFQERSAIAMREQAAREAASKKVDE